MNNPAETSTTRLSAHSHKGRRGRRRFDEASARYAEFGPFYVSYVTPAAELLKHCRIGGA